MRELLLSTAKCGQRTYNLSVISINYSVISVR
jgi:hypothetical protein